MSIDQTSPSTDAPSAVVTGGPGLAPTTPPSAPPTPQTVELKLGGAAHAVPSDLAEALRRELNTRDGRYGSELARLRQETESLRAQLSQVQTPPQTAAQPDAPSVRPPDPSLILDNPREYQRQQTEYFDAIAARRVAEAEEQRRAEAAQQTQQAEALNRWQATINRFYESNPHLKGFERTVDGVWKDHAGKLREYQDVDEALVELARLSEDEIIRHSQKAREIAERRKPTLESSGRRAARVPQAAPGEDKQPTLSELIRAKQARFKYPNLSSTGANPRA